MKAALIIFVRNPVLGKVKTRLAAAVGAENALHIYKKLLAHTHSVAQKISADKFIFYADYINQDDLWENEIFYKEIQNGIGLGERMANAFDLVFNKGYREIVIIGSDCYELDQEILQQAFNNLKDEDVVIGPAKDGGYYLLGINTFIPDLFENKNWSMPDVYEETIAQINELGNSLYILPALNDVDEIGDVTFTY